MPKAQEPFEILDNVLALIRVMLKEANIDWNVRLYNDEVVEEYPYENVFIRITPDQNGSPLLSIHTPSAQRNALWGVGFSGIETRLTISDRDKVAVMGFPDDPAYFTAVGLLLKMGAAARTYMRNFPEIYRGAK